MPLLSVQRVQQKAKTCNAIVNRDEISWGARGYYYEMPPFLFLVSGKMKKKKSFFFELVLVQLAEYGLINSCFKHDRKYKIKTNDLFAGQTH